MYKRRDWLLFHGQDGEGTSSDEDSENESEEEEEEEPLDEEEDADGAEGSEAFRMLSPQCTSDVVLPCLGTVPEELMMPNPEAQLRK